MPWITLLVMVLTFIFKKSEGADTGEALVTAGLAGGATYLLTHSDVMEDTTLAELDGVTSSTAEELNPDGTLAVDIDGNPIPNVTIEGATGLSPTVKDLVPFVSGAVLGTTASGDTNWWMWIALGLGAFMLLGD